MDSRSHKFYHVDGFDSRLCLNTYFSDNPEMAFEVEALKFPMEKLHHVFSMGHIKGDILIDLSIGPLVHHLYSACGFFKDIYLLKISEKCIMELNRWLNTYTGAFEWNHTLSYVTALEGNRDQCEDREIMLKTAIKQIVQCDVDKENLTDSVVLPQADCVISAWLLDVICRDHDDYIRYLRKLAKFVKPGGHLILLGNLNATFFMLGQDRFHCFTFNENYVKQALSGEGFIIDHCDIYTRKAVSDLCDYNEVLFIAAHKDK
ncbi:nicotinamide N-methyltransferase-like [Mixophyes fleayi]|uniref:nicotinamide N-methyltransferase-like n=1 Tax=Mixophyes fleayi TaxID=3061075 RepID=UPI003F4DB6B6